MQNDFGAEVDFNKYFKTIRSIQEEFHIGENQFQLFHSENLKRLSESFAGLDNLK